MLAFIAAVVSVFFSPTVQGKRIGVVSEYVARATGFVQARSWTKLFFKIVKFVILEDSLGHIIHLNVQVSLLIWPRNLISTARPRKWARLSWTTPPTPSRTRPTKSRTKPTTPSTIIG